MDKDIEHLRLLSIFHYVVGGLMGLTTCIPVIHLVIGLVMTFAPDRSNSGANQPPRVIGIMFIVIASIFIVVGWTIAALVLYAGRCLGRRKRYSYCFVIACISCVFFPLGTALGIFTLIVLNRDSVKPLFAVSRSPAET